MARRCGQDALANQVGCGQAKAEPRVIGLDRMHSDGALRNIYSKIPGGILRWVEAEECTLTLASGGSTHHGTGETCRKVATHLWPRAERETSRRCGGEPLRPGRIGESGRDVGRRRTDPHAQTEIVPDIFETLCH